MINPKRLPKPDHKEFESTLKRRGVKYYYHYSCISNLPSILEHGILSRKELNARKIKPVQLHGWGHKYWEMEDFICLCLTPPKGMLKRFKNPYLALAIPAMIAGYKGAYFSPTNSAKDTMDFDDILGRESIDAFECLFHHDEGDFLKSRMTEILIQNHIDSKEIVEIVFPEWTLEVWIWWIKGLLGLSPIVKVDSSLFCL